MIGRTQGLRHKLTGAAREIEQCVGAQHQVDVDAETTREAACSLLSTAGGSNAHKWPPGVKSVQSVDISSARVDVKRDEMPPNTFADNCQVELVLSTVPTHFALPRHSRR